jgi:hypothetical protein
MAHWRSVAFAGVAAMTASVGAVGTAEAQTSLQPVCFAGGVQASLPDEKSDKMTPVVVEVAVCATGSNLTLHHFPRNPSLKRGSVAPEVQMPSSTGVPFALFRAADLPSDGLSRRMRADDTVPRSKDGAQLPDVRPPVTLKIITVTPFGAVTLNVPGHTVDTTNPNRRTEIDATNERRNKAMLGEGFRTYPLTTSYDGPLLTADQLSPSQKATIAAAYKANGATAKLVP